VVRRRGYYDHYVTICVGVHVCGYVSMIKENPDGNDLKLGTIVVLDTMSKPLLTLDSKGQGSALGLGLELGLG